jgi:Caspase domain
VRSRRRALACLALTLSVAWEALEAPASAAAPTDVPARFALIIGVNRSVDPDAAPLRYADDDAAKYQELFRGLGARTYLVARLDANTERLHGQAAAEAREPTQAEFGKVVDELAADVRFAQKRRLRTIVYVVYSGHGNVEKGRAYLALEDARLFGSDLDTLILDRLNATEFHVIVDACYSNLLASPRGPGGHRREWHGFSAHAGIRPRANVGLLFSTSSAKESHEWQGVESGIFSHEVRSGLYGAADADGDGLVTYPEIAAFVERANAAIPGERFRPDVYAHPPVAETTLVDLRALSRQRIDISGAEHAHYTLEDGRGVQVAEFHNGADQPVSLVTPARSSPLYLRRVDDDVEFAIPMTFGTVRLAELTATRPSVAQRGAAALSFGRIFALPFGPSWVHGLATDEPASDDGTRHTGRAWAGWSLMGVGAVGLAVGTAATISAARARASLAPDASGMKAAAVNGTLDARRWQATLGFGVGALGVAAGTALLLWPVSRNVSLTAGPTGLDVAGTF